jgi:tetratricopeptide (TPR) repeat protein
MRRVTALLFVSALVCGLSLGQSSPQAPQKVLALTHVTVIDVTGGPALPDRTVMVTGNRITAIGASSKISGPKDAKVVDASGKFLIPGLWDMHVHWYERDYYSLFLANGVTGIRMMWGLPDHHQLRKEVEAGQFLGPRMVIASGIIDGPVPYWPSSISVHNAAEAREAVHKEKEQGADFIKVYSLLPREPYFAIADEAKKLGIPFAGHVPDAISAEEASDAGQRTMEHLIGVLSACSSREKELLEAAQGDVADMLASGKPSFTGPRQRALRDAMLGSYDAEKASQLFSRFKKNGTWQCPTLTVLRSLAYRDQASFRDDARLEYMPYRIRGMWAGDNAAIQGKSPEDYAFSKREFEKDLELVGAMNRAGVDIIAGTDVLNPFCFPGFSLHDELEMYVKAGLSPMEALRTATANPARLLGREKDLGTVETGKLADLVLLDANPLENINNIRKISALVYDGNYYPRETLDGMLAKVEALASRKSIGETLAKTIAAAGIDAAVKQYHELRTTQANAYDFSEDELNILGYRLLGTKKPKEAIAVFQLNVEAYPQSGNVYDSLGEAYMDNGDKEPAIANYRKSLQLNPANKNAEEMLKKLTAPQ